MENFWARGGAYQTMRIFSLCFTKFRNDWFKIFKTVCLLKKIVKILKNLENCEKIWNKIMHHLHIINLKNNAKFKKFYINFK